MGLALIHRKMNFPNVVSLLSFKLPNNLITACCFVFKLQSTNFKTLTPEEILNSRQRYQQVLLDSKFYPEYQSLKKQERIFTLLGKIPFLGEAIATQLPRKIPSKVSLQEKLFKIIEK